jgi:hypothetical protein
MAQIEARRGSGRQAARPSTKRSIVLSKKRLGVLLAASAMAFALLAAGMAMPERAQALEIGPSPTINSTPDDTWMTNGKVFSIIRSGNYIYVGGQFSRVQSEVSGGQSFAAKNLARFHADTGVGDPTLTPDVTGEDPSATRVDALAEANGKIWVGGRFGAIDGVARRNLAAVSPDTGEVDSTIDPVVGSQVYMVRAMIVSGQKVYIGGAFGSVDGKSRTNLAAIDPVSGNVDPTWKPKADRPVYSLAFSCDGSGVFAGGKFLNAAGSDGVFSARTVIARFNATSGALHPWAVPASTFEGVDEGFVASDMAVTCERITTGFLGHPNWVRSFRLDNGETGSMAWGYRTGGDVQAVTMLGPNKVILGGHFKWVKDRVPRTCLAMVNFSDGSADPSWNVALTAGSTKAIGPWDLLVDENHLYVGGHFTEVRTGSSVINQTGFTRFTFAP